VTSTRSAGGAGKKKPSRKQAAAQSPKRAVRKAKKPPARTRRVGSEGAESRTALLDAARALMLEQGYASVTARRVAARAGLKPQLVHYYFLSMDDLFISLFRRDAEANFKRQARVLASDAPLRALWSFSSDRAAVALTTEFMALANHRKAIRAEIAHFARQFREAQAEIVRQALERHGVDPTEFSTEAVLVMMTGLSRVVAMEEDLDVTDGHAEALALAERWLERLEGPAPSGEARRK